MNTKVKKRRWRTHLLAWCKEKGCGWESGDHINGMRRALQHHKKTGHYVEAEEGHHIEYGEREDRE